LGNFAIKLRGRTCFIALREPYSPEEGPAIRELYFVRDSKAEYVSRSFMFAKCAAVLRLLTGRTARRDKRRMIRSFTKITARSAKFKRAGQAIAGRRKAHATVFSGGILYRKG
jgi:hypothetical protein